MLGILFFVLLLVLGLYLVGDSALRALRCRALAEATVLQGTTEATLDRQGKPRRAAFPRYGFTADGRSLQVLDYNAGRHARLSPGDRVLLRYDPAHPQTLWYVAGRLWPDFVWGGCALAGAAFVAFLFVLP